MEETEEQIGCQRWERETNRMGDGKTERQSLERSIKTICYS